MIHRILAIAWKETIHIRRDFRTLYLAFALPLMMLFLFGYAIEFDIDRISTGICDQDRTPESRNFTAKLSAGDWFRIQGYYENPELLADAMDHGKIKIAIVIPAGFSKSLKRGETTSLQAVIDGSDNNGAAVGQNYLALFEASYGADLFNNYLKRSGLIARNPTPPGILPSPYVLFNPELKSRFYILPGIIALTTAILAALLTSLVIAREWERGTMEQLIATPVRPAEIILGKILPYTGISIFQTLVTALVAIIVFQIPYRGNVFMLFLGSLLFAIGTLGLGMMLSSALKSQLPAMQAAFVATMLPGIILSNFVFPIESMPPIIRFITYVIPAKYFLVILRTNFLKGTNAYLLEMGFLALYAFLVLNVAIRKLKKKVG